jgi:hypothetical protein
MVVGPEEKVAYAIFFRNNTAKAAHIYSLSDWEILNLKVEIFARVIKPPKTYLFMF